MTAHTVKIYILNPDQNYSLCTFD